MVSVIVTGSRGSLVNEEGIDLNRALNELKQKGHFDGKHPDYRELSALEAVQTAEYDVVMELTIQS